MVGEPSHGRAASCREGRGRQNNGDKGPKVGCAGASSTPSPAVRSWPTLPSACPSPAPAGQVLPACVYPLLCTGVTCAEGGVPSAPAPSRKLPPDSKPCWNPPRGLRRCLAWNSFAGCTGPGASRVADAPPPLLVPRPRPCSPLSSISLPTRGSQGPPSSAWTALRLSLASPGPTESSPVSLTRVVPPGLARGHPGHLQSFHQPSLYPTLLPTRHGFRGPAGPSQHLCTPLPQMHLTKPRTCPRPSRPLPASPRRGQLALGGPGPQPAARTQGLAHSPAGCLIQT